jgi:hypothetical protein
MRQNGSFNRVAGHAAQRFFLAGMFLFAVGRHFLPAFFHERHDLGYPSMITVVKTV